MCKFFSALGRGILNLLFFRKNRQKRALQNMIICIEEQAADDFLDILLKVMGLTFFVDKDFRRNIENFSARYVFQDKIGEVYVAAIFENNKLTVNSRKINDPTFTLIFRDGSSLVKFLLSPSPDILNALLNQEIDFFGNLNYINKFAYLAMRLKMMVTPA
ncbi:MAG: hypothetical protein LBS37_08860 [Treponema sp.]|jgi:hypothetical protein|nr:hypothetical protein [Treponema sp.]